jgi:hypothetical protein
MWGEDNHIFSFIGYSVVTKPNGFNLRYLGPNIYIIYANISLNVSNNKTKNKYYDKLLNLNDITLKQKIEM